MEEHKSIMSDAQPEPMKLDINKLPPAIRAHMPNQSFSMSDGTAYDVQENGSWKKVAEGMSYKKRRKLGLA
jgi:hypothetical protein